MTAIDFVIQGKMSLDFDVGSFGALTAAPVTICKFRITLSKCSLPTVCRSRPKIETLNCEYYVENDTNKHRARTTKTKEKISVLDTKLEQNATSSRTKCLMFVLYEAVSVSVSVHLYVCMSA